MLHTLILIAIAIFAWRICTAQRREIALRESETASKNEQVHQEWLRCKRQLLADDELMKQDAEQAERRAQSQRECDKQCAADRARWNAVTPAEREAHPGRRTMRGVLSSLGVNS